MHCIVVRYPTVAAHCVDEWLSSNLEFTAVSESYVSAEHGSSNWVALARTLNGSFDEAWSAIRNWQFPKDCQTRQLYTQAMICPEV